MPCKMPTSEQNQQDALPETSMQVGNARIDGRRLIRDGDFKLLD